MELREALERRAFQVPRKIPDLKNALESEHDEEAKVIALAREQCLLYVGSTRAREKLLVTYAQRRSSFLREAGCGLPF
jgi:superfamily I DNA/RNA helicase